MRKSVLIILFVFSSVLFSQTSIKVISSNAFEAEITIPEPFHKISHKGKFSVIDYPEYSNYSKAGEYKLPYSIFTFAIPKGSEPKIKVVSKKEEVLRNVVPALNPEIKRLNDSTLVEVPATALPAKIQNADDIEILNKFWFRDFYCVSVKINSHKYFPSSNQLKEIKKLKLKFQFQNVSLKNDSPIIIRNSYDKLTRSLISNAEIAEQFRSHMPNNLLADTTGQWINYDADYIKIAVARNGIYRFYGSRISSLGYDISSIIPSQLQLYESGNLVPIIVFDGNDGSFDENDYIEFWGHKNRPKGNYKIINADNEEYNEFENRYTDTTYYFLTWNNGNTKNLFIQDNFNNNLQDTLNYYTEILHSEKNNWIQNMNGDETVNQLPDWNKNKTWYWGWIGYWSPTKNFSFSAEGVVPNKSARAYFKASVAGLRNYMRFKLSVNNVQLDSQRVNKFHQVLLSGEFDSSILTESGNNLKEVCFSEDGNYAAYDWYEIDYPRQLNLVNDSLTIIVPNDVNPGEKVFSIENATSSSYMIYKIFPKLKKISNYSVNNGKLYFSDTVNVNNKYFICHESNILSPQNYYSKHFINLRSSQIQADYITITNKIFDDDVDNYLNYISSEYNLNVYRADVSDIFDEFSFGYPYPVGIKLFLYKAYTNWKQPKPQFVTLIGDASYDYKYIKFRNEGVKSSINYVPSRGYPVGDNWYVAWDETAPPVPQLMLGRIPILNPDELGNYLAKLQSENSKLFGDWNKRSLFFSGGNPNVSGEIETFRTTSESIINQYVKPKPLAGKYTHFYKTVDPPSDFGPYTQEEVNNAIEKGGVFISYLGHSGTATWDNGINSVIQLQNNEGRFPLITDFGCSTNKFAEPDIVCFGERFILDNSGEAIGYLGNSSLGFFTTSTKISKVFYEKMIYDSLYTIGEAHAAAKIDMFNLYGTSNVYRIFAYTNVFLGEPVFQVKLPYKPNLSINNSSLITDVSALDDQSDSVAIKIVYQNLGLANDSSFNIKIEEKYSGENIHEKNYQRILPDYSDTLVYFMHTKGLSGPHILKVTLDDENVIDEIYEDDNQYNFEINVYSTSIRDLVNYDIENGNMRALTIVNPVTKKPLSDKIKVYLSDDGEFSSPVILNQPMGAFYTNINFPDLSPDKRYWYKFKINLDEAEFSVPRSFNTKLDYKFLLSDSISFDKQLREHLSIDRVGLSLVDDSINISVLSAGWYCGATCVIALNGENLLRNSFFPGMGIVVFDSVSFHVDTTAVFPLFGNPDNVQALADMINGIPTGKIVALGVADDARNNMSTELKNAIKALGSSKIDSLQFRGSWAIIGRKGAPTGSVPEGVKGPYDGQVYIDTTYVLKNAEGNLTTTLIGPAPHWKQLTVSDSIPAGSSINYRILGKKSENVYDTLNYLSLHNGSADLSFLNDSGYSYIKVQADFKASPEKVSPVFKSLGVDYNTNAELGTNYQVVSISKDTLKQGEDVSLNFYVYNVGGSTADSFYVSVDLKKGNTFERNVFSRLVDSLGAGNRRKFSFDYNTASLSGENNFTIRIDTSNVVPEFFEDNNYYPVSFYVEKDTTRPTVEITFNGKEILDGEYISPEPEIKINLDDETLVPVTDTSAVTLFLNNEPVYYSGNPDINFSFSSENPKVTVEYTPKLKSGSYTLAVLAKNGLGTLADSSGIIKNFTVNSEAKLLNVYNYPNPFSDDTYFTFKLTRIPDKMGIDIYTVAGRLINKIIISPSELNYDFNKIYWDGKDFDGDRIANGVYFYKIKMKFGDKEITDIRKLAVMR